MRKIVTLISILLFLIAVGISILSKQAPGLLVASIEKALNRKVSVGAVHYQFPSYFEIERFEIREDPPFAGEPLFQADDIQMSVSPISLYEKKLVIDKIEVTAARVFLRKIRGRVLHALSGATNQTGEGASPSGAPGAVRGRAGMPLAIREFILTKSDFQFVDYDVEEKGFVVAFEDIDARVKNIERPPSPRRVFYRANARMLQGRDERPAEFSVSGWTRPDRWDTEASFSAKGVYIPYFRPYYAQVTDAAIEDGYGDARLALSIDKKYLTGTADFEIAGLLFQSYETGDQLFGLKAGEILSFLKDSSGRLKFQISFDWDLKDRSVKAKNVVRRSIEKSLKNTVIGNVENLLTGALRLKKVKGLFG